MFTQFIKETGLPENTVKTALKATITQSLSDCLGASDSIVSLEDRIVTGVFQVPFDMAVEEALFFNNAVVENDVVTIRFSFLNLPDRVVKYCGKIFPRIVLDMDASQKYSEWQPKCGTVVEGIVKDKNDEIVEIDFGQQDGFMLKAEWVHGEHDKYKAGKPLLVYILRAERNGADVKVFASRHSRNLVSCLFRQQLPWYRFFCVRRMPGKHSVVLTDCPLDDSSLKAVKKEVGEEVGERLVLKKIAV
ncbi:MAG: hypothetical protein U9Q84_00215 [Thermodesulfobacteriota bacterium]|nr:hypothetical protein [Thermodesulfobacteriota bacterium]